jgi:protein phosphatase
MSKRPLKRYIGSFKDLSIGEMEISAKTDVGLRDRQEDRMLVYPRVLGENDVFLGVFDGTVGDAASHFVQGHFMDHLFATKGFQELQRLQNNGNLDSLPLERRAAFLHSALYDTYFTTDASLIEECERTSNHYAASTSVTAVISGSLLSVAHVADSKACLARLSPSKESMIVEWLTRDHKPNDPRELSRIESQGGSLVYLHEGKPYIRGGDFHARQKRGERPKQLNYSRAFGGKDLKNYGLSVEPAITHFRLSPEDKLLILASDGLWDVFDHRTAVSIALQAIERNEDPAEQLVSQAIRYMPSRNVRDNVTVLVCQLNMSEQSQEGNEDDEQQDEDEANLLRTQQSSRIVSPELFTGNAQDDEEEKGEAFLMEELHQEDEDEDGEEREVEEDDDVVVDGMERKDERKFS